MSDRVRFTITDGVADVRLNRPEKRNAIDLAMLDALISTGEALAADGSVLAVVLSGEGRSFCAGLDLGAFGSDGGKNGTLGDGFAARALSRRDGRMVSVAQESVAVWSALPVPVIAAVHGHALGGGLQLALAADIRFVAPDAQFSVLEIRWGLVPDMTGSQVLPDLVGRDVAKELTFTGRMVTGDEAVRIGLATRLCDSPLDDALALARQITEKSPSAIRAAKELLDMAGRVPMEEGLLAEQAAQARMIGSADQMEAITAFFEGRAPRWPR
jgi:enoyl-CoA hydratase/carnithine racemase